MFHMPDVSDQKTTSITSSQLRRGREHLKKKSRTNFLNDDVAVENDVQDRQSKTLFASILSVPKMMEHTFQTLVWHRTKAARNSCFLVETRNKNSASGSLKIKTQTPRLLLTISRLMTGISFHSTCTIIASHQRSLPVVQKFFHLLFQK